MADKCWMFQYGYQVDGLRFLCDPMQASEYFFRLAVRAVSKISEETAAHGTTLKHEFKQRWSVLDNPQLEDKTELAMIVNLDALVFEFHERREGELKLIASFLIHEVPEHIQSYY